MLCLELRSEAVNFVKACISSFAEMSAYQDMKMETGYSHQVMILGHLDFSGGKFCVFFFQEGSYRSVLTKMGTPEYIAQSCSREGRANISATNQISFFGSRKDPR